MRSERIYAAIGAADDELLIRCGAVRRSGKTKWIKYGSIAACLCLAVLGAISLYNPFTPDFSSRPVLHWSEGFLAADYFKYNSGADDGMSSSNSLADAIMPYAESRSFSEERAQFETEGIIPIMPEHPLFDCSVNYDEDGGIYHVVFSWHRRNIRNSDMRIDLYSDLSITAGYQEIEQISDCIFVELDDNGAIIAPAITVTERNGIQIVAEGNENRGKTITFQNESGWYQISGSWNDSYESMVVLLDWIWEHPIDFNRFPIDAGDHFTVIKLEQMPDAFSGYIPDFASLGFIEETNYLQLKNGAPYAYEGQFIAHVPEELVKQGSYYDIDGWTIIHWCIATNPEYYLLSESLGELDSLTEQLVYDQFDSSGNQSKVVFAWDGLLIQIYSNTAQELWEVLQLLQQSR